MVARSRDLTRGYMVLPADANKLLTFAFGGFYLRGTRLRARETGGPVHGTRGVNFAPFGLTKSRSLARRGYGNATDLGRVSHNSEASYET